MDFIRMFNMIDTDNSGEITRSELIKFMQDNNFTETFVDKWLALFDFNQKGRITMDDFCDRLGLVIDEDMSRNIKHHRPSYINLDNLDELDDFVDVDDQMEQHIIHVSTNKPISTPTKRNYNFQDKYLDEIPEMSDIKKEVIVKKTAFPLFGMSQSNTNSLKKNSKKENKNENATDVQTPQTRFKKDLSNQKHNSDSGQRNQQIFRNNTMPPKSVEKSPKFGGIFSFGKSKKVKTDTLESSKTNENKKSNQKLKLGTESLDRNLESKNNFNVKDSNLENQPSTSTDFHNQKEKDKNKRKTINSGIQDNNFEHIDPNSKQSKHQNSLLKIFQKDKKSPKKDTDKQTKNIKESKEIKTKSNSDEKTKLKNEQKLKNNDKENFEKNKEIKEVKIITQKEESKKHDLDTKLHDLLMKRDCYLSNDFLSDEDKHKSVGHEEFEKELDKMILDSKSFQNRKSYENSFRKSITSDKESPDEVSNVNLWGSLDENINEIKLDYLLNKNSNDKNNLFEMKNNKNQIINNKNNHVNLDFFKRPSEIDFPLPKTEEDIFEEIIIPQNVVVTRNERKLTIPDEITEEKLFPNSRKSNMSYIDENIDTDYDKYQQCNKTNESIIQSTINNDLNKIKDQQISKPEKNQIFDIKHQLNSFDNIEKSALRKPNVDYNLNEKIVKNEIEVRKNLEKSTENNENIYNSNLSGEFNDERQINFDDQLNINRFSLDKKININKKDFIENPVNVNDKNKIKDLVDNKSNDESKNEKKLSNQKFSDSKSKENNNEELMKNEEYIKSKISKNSPEFQNKHKDEINVESNINEDNYTNLQDDHEHLKNVVSNEKQKNIQDKNEENISLNKNYLDRKSIKNFDNGLKDEIIGVHNRNNKVKGEIQINDNKKILSENNRPNKLDELTNQKENNENKNLSFSLVNQSENFILPRGFQQNPSENEFSKYVGNKKSKINRNKLKIIYKDYAEKDFPNLLDDIVNIYEETKLLEDWNGHELMKNYLDKYYERIWSVIIIDNSYDLYVTYENMIIFNYDSLTFIIWKTFESL